MKTKRQISFFFVVLLSLMLTLSAYAQEFTPYYVGDGKVTGRISRGTSSYAVVANTNGATDRVEVTGSLYEDGWLWDTKVSSCSNSAAGTACTASGSYTFDNSKKYRLEYSATFYYSNGTSETVTGSTTG